ncbi:MAG: hypothetical protein RIB54_15525 [Fulvivirga sp.]
MPTNVPSFLMQRSGIQESPFPYRQYMIYILTLSDPGILILRNRDDA